MRARGERLERVLEHLVEVEGHVLELELAGLDLGEVEDVVDHLSSDVGRVLDAAARYSRCSPVRSASSSASVRHADDAVHRRADLVAHVGEELALGAVRRLGRLLGALEPLAVLALLPQDSRSCWSHWSVIFRVATTT